MDEKLKRLKKEAELAGLHININKTKGMRVNTSDIQKFRVDETEIAEVVTFVYLGSVVSVKGGTEKDAASRITEQMVYLFKCILYGEITTYQKELKYEY
jgi:hypothetical protein